MPEKFYSSYQSILILASGVLIAAVLVGSVSAGQTRIQPQEESGSSQSEIRKEKIPTIKLDAPQPPILSARAVYAIDFDSRVLLYAKDENDPVLPASTTKIATALVALDYYGLDQVLTVGKVGVNIHTMGLRPGEKITAENLLYGLLVYSANDAAAALASNYPAGQEAFVGAMNALADRLGLTKTHFTNPSGFDEYLHFSTAKDITGLTGHALTIPTFAKMVATDEFKARNADGTVVYKLTNTNQLLGKVRGVLGVKTGQTESSGESLVTLVQRDGYKVIISLMNSADRFDETQVLIDWIFASYEWK